MLKPKIIEEEYILKPHTYIMSKTDKRGRIVYVNDDFEEVSGYSKKELIGESHNIIRHPDMPKVIFKILWESILAKKNITLLIKNLRKDGKYYWVITDFEVVTDERGNIINFYAYRKAPPRDSIKEIEKLYKELSEIEKKRNIQEAEIYLKKFLEKKRMSFEEYINHLIGNETFVQHWINNVKDLF